MDKPFNKEEEIFTKLDALFDCVIDDRTYTRKALNVLAEYVDDLWDKWADYEAVQWNERRLRNLRNEVTYLHNELNEVKKNLGMDGSVPRIKSTRKYKTYEGGGV